MPCKTTISLTHAASARTSNQSPALRHFGGECAVCAEFSPLFFFFFVFFFFFFFFFFLSFFFFLFFFSAIDC